MVTEEDVSVAHTDDPRACLTGHALLMLHCCNSLLAAPPQRDFKADTPDDWEERKSE